MSWNNVLKAVVEANAAKRHCDPLACLSQATSARYGLVVPAYNETIDTLSRLLSSTVEDGAHAIVVVNESRPEEQQGIEAVIAQNALLVEQLADHAAMREGRLSVLHVRQPVTYGVGGARRLGCIALRVLQHAKLIESRWLHNTDADSVLPVGFFSETERVLRDDSTMCLHSLTHSPEEQGAALQSASIIRAVLTLCILHLQDMRSPWAFTSTGCGVSIADWAYDAVAGWPPISVCEDLYMEALLAKLGRVHRMPHLRVQTSARRGSKPIAWPGESTDGAGHGALIGAIENGVASGAEMVASAPKGYDAMRVIYDVIWAYLDGTYEGDMRPCIERAIAARGFDWLDAKLVDEVLCTVVGSMQNYTAAPAGRERRLAFFHAFDQQAQQSVMENIYPHIDRVPVDQCVNESPFGVKHEGDWFVTAERLAELEEARCTADVGTATL